MDAKLHIMGRWMLWELKLDKDAAKN
ncbi:hypothetical protein CCACVL1_30334 [Corchorus capsularis]|uniref:Uncharacterized protein n=1 Tax=Corchorus capsularis TaxID=210143 RepID=A0A1R3FXS3_COCAP|nr:hypothetical protein CCACVL1_30335 [Corchorus capsularis]OMO50650.1 hypothetical protein CCACVL1_30334 [Corchorus capsularis]